MVCKCSDTSLKELHETRGEKGPPEREDSFQRSWPGYFDYGKVVYNQGTTPVTYISKHPQAESSSGCVG